MEFLREKYPKRPGVYIMKDAENNVIYIGKAASLRNRLSQYFTGSHDAKTSLLVRKIHDIEFVVTRDEGEALILESNLIKAHQPRFNMGLKDDKHFSYLAITNEKFPRLLVSRRNSKRKFAIKSKYLFGPFTEGSKRTLSARYLRKLFKIRICKKMPKKECLQYHLGNCDAPCTNRISEEDYAANIKSLALVLKGRKKAKEVIANLKRRMREAAKEEDFESAAALRDQIESLDIFFERQGVEQKESRDEDYIFFGRIGNILHVQMLRSQRGVISKSIRHTLEINDQEEPEIAFCLQFYGEDLPARVYSNLKNKQMEKLNSALNREIFRRASGSRKKTLEIASLSLEQKEIDPAVLELKEELGLQTNPTTIETFDISTLFGENSVGSMVRFVNGKPDKSEYRRFRIKSVEGQDDFSMMHEVVLRRYSRLLSEGAQMPDLVLIDGGVGQLNAALSALDETGVKLQIASIAKKEEEIYLPNKMRPLRLSKRSAALKLLQRCRDEAHRFAITYHRKRRSAGRRNRTSEGTKPEDIQGRQSDLDQ